MQFEFGKMTINLAVLPRQQAVKRMTKALTRGVDYQRSGNLRYLLLRVGPLLVGFSIIRYS